MGSGVQVFMKAWRKISAAVIALTAMIFVGANLFLNYHKAPENGRQYRVEVNRLALLIGQDGLESVDLDECEYVNSITRLSRDFDSLSGGSNDSDYMLRGINGELYRFDYTAKGTAGNLQVIVAVNVILAVMSAMVLGILFYIRGKILQPFERLANVPYELAKGNLILPVKESRSRFFGRFLWGVDLLRENIEQQKMRELALQKEKKTLLLSLSHDIKTPLSAIKLYAKALSKNLYPDREKQCEIAENINKKADEIEMYVARIIIASREEFLSLDVQNAEFYLSDLTGNIAAYYKEKLALAKTELVIGEYGNCLVLGDLERSVEVLQNVIENALKYGDGKRIELLFPHDDEGVLISVRNSGCALEKSDLPHIFESFWRGANSENIQGNGLGLYICRQLMHKMNGEIFAEINGDNITVTMVFGRV